MSSWNTAAPSFTQAGKKRERERDWEERKRKKEKQISLRKRKHIFSALPGKDSTRWQEEVQRMNRAIPSWNVSLFRTPRTFKWTHKPPSQTPAPSPFTAMAIRNQFRKIKTHSGAQSTVTEGLWKWEWLRGSWPCRAYRELAVSQPE